MIDMKKLFSFNSELNKVTGVQKVLLDIHHAVKDTYNAKIVGTIPYGQVNKNHGITQSEYKRFKNPFMFYNSIVIVHERKFLLMFWLMNHLLFQRIKLVYVHHNLFNDHRLLSVMPKTVVSISERTTRNLIEFFRVPPQNIHKIYNCVKEKHPSQRTYHINDKITLVYPARINQVKRQDEVYKQLKGKIDKRIQILFAGEGPNYQALKSLVGEDEQFKCLGFVDDIIGLLQQSDYMMLFSSKEGLPITLIEAAMCYTPIVCNDVGGNCEIARNGQNAFVANDWEELIRTVNRLPTLDATTYMYMANRSREIYEQNFTFEKFKNNYLNLLNHLT